MSYHQLQTRAALIAQMLHSFSVEPGDRVAIFAENSVEWIESYLGITCMGGTAVPIDSKLREQEVTHILHDSAARVLITTAKSYPILREIEDKLPHLQTVLLIGGNTQLPADSTHVHYDDYHTQVHNMNDTDASERIYNTLQPKPTDVASLIYTSGTTGRPKGAMLTHRNFTSDVEYCRQAFADITNRDNFLLVLPLHHAFAFTTCLLLPIALGGSISIVASLKTLAEKHAGNPPLSPDRRPPAAGKNVCENFGWHPAETLRTPAYENRPFQTGRQKKFSQNLAAISALSLQAGRRVTPT